MLQGETATLTATLKLLGIISVKNIQIWLFLFCDKASVQKVAWESY